jgi:hypothetical protein
MIAAEAGLAKNAMQTKTSRMVTARIGYPLCPLQPK